jgi:hypothetical protein
MMMMKPNIPVMVVLALLSAGAALLAGHSPADADELGDRRAQQAQTNARIDALAKPADPTSGDQPTPDNPRPSGTSGAGSFPRSFLIPGTDTSVRIGGSVDATLGYR